MDKKQQIEEMAKIINELYWVYTTTETDIAEGIYQAGYRKIDENCAVITKDEFKLYQRQAVKEFADELKKKVHNYYPSIDSYCTSRHVILVKDIDELLKE